MRGNRNLSSHPRLPFPEGPDERSEKSATKANFLLENLPYELSEVVPENVLQRAMSSSIRRAQFTICFPSSYEEHTLRPLGQLVHLVDGELSRTQQSLKGRRGSLLAEKEQLLYIGRLIEELGTHAASDFITERARGPLEKEYEKRIYGSGAEGRSEFGKRSVLPLLERWHSSSTGLSQGLLHPKEALLFYLLDHSTHLANGGRLVVFCNHEGTRDHLLRLLQKSPRVSHSTPLHDLAGSPIGRDELRSQGHATSLPDRKVEVVIGTARDFAQAKNSGLEHLEGAIFLVYQLHSPKFGRQRDLIPRSAPSGIPEVFATSGPVNPLQQRLHLPTLSVQQSVLFDSSVIERDIRACFSLNTRI